MTPDLKKKRTLMMVVGTAVTLASNSATYKKKYKMTVTSDQSVA